MSEFIPSDRRFTSSNENNNVHDAHGENKLKKKKQDQDFACAVVITREYPCDHVAGTFLERPTCS